MGVGQIEHSINTKALGKLKWACSAWWHTPLIPTPQEAEPGRLQVRGQAEQLNKTLSENQV